MGALCFWLVLIVRRKTQSRKLVHFFFSQLCLSELLFLVDWQSSDLGWFMFFFFLFLFSFSLGFLVNQTEVFVTFFECQAKDICVIALLLFVAFRVLMSSFFWLGFRVMLLFLPCIVRFEVFGCWERGGKGNWRLFFLFSLSLFYLWVLGFSFYFKIRKKVIFLYFHRSQTKPLHWLSFILFLFIYNLFFLLSFAEMFSSIFLGIYTETWALLVKVHLQQSFFFHFLVFFFFVLFGGYVIILGFACMHVGFAI